MIHRGPGRYCIERFGYPENNTSISQSLDAYHPIGYSGQEDMAVIKTEIDQKLAASKNDMVRISKMFQISRAGAKPPKPGAKSAAKAKGNAKASQPLPAADGA